MTQSSQSQSPAAISRPQFLHWCALSALVVLWGSRFYAVEIALIAFTPLTIVFFQIVIASAVLYLVLRIRGARLPRDLRSWLFFNAMALIGNVLPFFLESWGQIALDSSLVGILLSVSPLSVLLLAHWLLPDERATGLRAMGFLFGLVGVVLLTGPDALRAVGGNVTSIISQLAILLAAVCYGLAAVITRLAPQHPPLVVASAVMVAAAMQMVPIWLWQSGMPDWSTVGLSSVLAIIGIGIFCTALAAVVFFFLVAHTGATFQSLVNYLLPVWALGIGTSLLDEPVPENGLLALAFIMVSLWLTQPRPAAPETQSPTT
ncbi:MAG: DMT family transporter [Woeseiaceae bacterium]